MANNSPVADLATGDGGKLLAQAMGISSNAGDSPYHEYGYNGDPAKVATLTPQDSSGSVMGASGTVIPFGFLSDEEYNTALVGRMGLLKFDEMRKSDATVRWSLQAVKLPIRAAEWRIEPASDDAKDAEIAEFVQWNLFERMNWTSILREMMTYLDFGFYLAEKAYVAEDYNGKPMIVLRSLESRKQTTIFRWEMGDGSPGVTQVTYKGTFNIPENKMVLLSHEREGNNYAGISLLRAAYKHWYIKDTLYKISAVAAERQGVGVVKIKQLAKPSEPERNQAVQAAQNLRANEEGYLEEPPGFDINFMDMFGRTTLDLAADIEHHNRQIMENVGAAFMEMGSHSGSGGTHGASQDQSRIFEMSVEGIANDIREALNAQAIRQLVDLNYTGITKYPTIEHDKIASDDFPTYAKAVADLVNADAITPDADMEQALRDRASLPDLPDDYREDYADRPRSQASTVPIVAPGQDPTDPMAPAGTPPQKQAPKNAKPSVPVQASELVESVKRFYSGIGDQLEAIYESDSST